MLEIKEQLESLAESIRASLSAVDLVRYENELKKLKTEQCDPKVYNDFEQLKNINKAISHLEDLHEPWKELQNRLNDTETLLQMAEEEGDQSQLAELDQLIKNLTREFNRLEILRLFKNPGDHANCYLTIHSGAGGTESCDWAMMLLRMYQRWVEEKKFSTQTLEYQGGEEAGIKSATLYIKGAYAFGLLKAEVGVHRLVRISPFDANKRRHTSFASVTVSPEILDDIEVVIKPSDLRIDTYRSSGAGGQHVNTTDSAVRITHEPTGLVVACQAERSQHQNREVAMKILKGKLYQYYREIKEQEASSKQIEKKKIEWGSQIRSYVFHPYNMVKDHRTLYETSNVNAVMDGEIDEFISNYLKQSVNQ